LEGAVQAFGNDPTMPGMYIDLSDTEHSWRAIHRLYLSFVQPRPIAFVSTVDELANDGFVTDDTIMLPCAYNPWMP